MKDRNSSLDVLRGIAVLMVVGHHYAFGRDSFLHVGGYGVDLFFVLSGFLISGLLFSEIRTTGKLSLTRFFIRRGLKIYPAFYAFLLLTLPMVPHLGPRLAAEGLFLQSYAPHIWQHTWSLSVEEIFYLLLPFVILLLSRYKRLSWIPAIFAALFLICIPARLIGPGTGFSEAHMRMDALFAGVVLGYTNHFRNHLFSRIAKHWSVLPAGIVFLIPAAFILKPSHSVGALINATNTLAFSCILWWSQGNGHLRSRLLQGIGRYSYSIYLWHMPVALFWSMALPMTFVGFGANMVSAVAIGIIMATLIEMPVLKLRDRLFPSTLKSPIRKNSVREIEENSSQTDAACVVAARIA